MRERKGVLTNFEQRCDRCGVEFVKHYPQRDDFPGLDGRLFKCRQCGAVLCSRQVDFSKGTPLRDANTGSHQVFPPPDSKWRSRYFAILVNNETGESEQSEGRMAVFCGFVDVVEQK